MQSLSSLRSTFVLFVMVLAATGCRERDPDDPDAGRVRFDAGDCEATGAENTAALCMDGVDNDCNGHQDCNDFDCCGLRTCDPSTVCGRQDGGSCDMTGPENTADACDDGVDNDCDGFTDCGVGSPADNDCRAFCGAENSNARCVNGDDDDRDGFLDCDDRDCEMRIVCAGEASNATCSDGVDNDGEDGMDCMDPDCQDEAIVVCDGTTAIEVPEAQWAAMVMTRCTNGTSDDADDRVDCGEFSCLWNYDGCVEPPREGTNALCDDGEDNDLDGLEDCLDPGCQQEGIAVCDGETAVDVAPANYGTASTAECTNSVDEDPELDDDDTPRVDCGDFSCSQNPDVDCPGENTDEECDDGVDNAPTNGFVDCADFSCLDNPAVTVCADAAENTYEECSNGLDDDGDGFVDCADFSGCAPPDRTPNVACR